MNPTDKNSFEGFWEDIHNSHGGIDRSHERYIVIDSHYTTQLLNDIWQQFTTLVKQNPHFSESERKIGMNIIHKLETLKFEAQHVWYTVMPHHKKKECGLRFFDQEFLRSHYNRPKKYTAIFYRYSEKQWKALHPEIPFPDHPDPRYCIGFDCPRVPWLIITSFHK